MVHRFFCWSPYSSGNILSKFHNFPQPDGLVQSVSRASLCGALFFVILEPKSYMVLAHKLQLDHGQYCGSILGLGLSYMQPTMNPYGYLVVKQAENLRYSACMENEERN